MFFASFTASMTAHLDEVMLKELFANNMNINGIKVMLYASFFWSMN